ncbi:GNAT family N-acetyltransferase [Occallatibacter riparius]|uniref:GNAT family N-acetyltransferase n=1 Tax=Occallatibacter riparius TaxID=1002689 RepID=A0A9J7BIF5_9BACT|nr:GNAT family N-acetyltransferase [Occallatibacter riparius]UWZ82576.1 GNAT family N-acetyltransferase [Occallatibacter riparius]
MDLRLRAYCANDFEFARGLYFQTMRWAIERIFGWDQAFQEANFVEWFKPDEISIIVADGADVGWIQQRLDGEAIFLGSIYIAPAMQRKGIGTRVIQATLDLARLRHQVVTLAVMKINPALALYERLGFRFTHQDEHKLYLRADPSSASRCGRITANSEVVISGGHGFSR